MIIEIQEKVKTLLVSIAMISFNHESFIAQAIEGVLMQKTDFDIELVISDDLSEDGTGKIIAEYALKYPNIIRLLTREARLGITRNFADTIKQCRGKYVAICEGDDYWSDEKKLQKQVTFLESNPDFAVCFHRVEFRYEEQDIQSQLSNVHQKTITTFEDLSYDNYICTLSTVFRHNLYNDFPPEAHQLAMADWTLHLLNAAHGKIMFLEDVMAVYRIHKNGAWSMKSSYFQMEKLIEAIELYLTYFSVRSKNGFKTLGAYLSSELCYTAFENGNYQHGKIYSWKAVKFGKNLTIRKKITLIIRYLLCLHTPTAKFYKFLVLHIKQKML